MNINGNINSIPDYNEGMILTIKNPQEIKQIRKLQEEFLKKNKVKQYGLSMDKDKYKLVKGKKLWFI